MPWVGLRCVIGVFPDHTHFLHTLLEPAHIVCQASPWKGYIVCIPIRLYKVEAKFIIAPVVLGAFVFGPCFEMQYLVSFLVFQSSRCERELAALLCVLTIM